MLESSGFQVVGTAENGEKAIQIYNKFPIKPDLILMDHRMPVKNGIEATKEILLINGKSKIIFLSADKSVKKLAFDSGAVGFLAKPFSFESLVNEIKLILNA